MSEFNPKEISNLFKNLCCSQCRNDFTSDSVSIKETEGDIRICSLTCKVCGKDFGGIVFNFNQKTDIHNPLEIIDGPPPITSDTAIDAHRFIKKMK